MNIFINPPDVLFSTCSFKYLQNFVTVVPQSFFMMLVVLSVSSAGCMYGNFIKYLARHLATHM